MSDGTVMVAGYNVQGQLSVGSFTNVTGEFLTAVNGTFPIPGIVKISANGGSTAEGNAVVLDSSGNVWAAGYNGHGELAQNDTTNRSLFWPVSGISGVVVDAGIGCGVYGVAYALTSAGVLYTWGYNGQNNLFQNNSTTPVKLAAEATYVPGAISKVFLPKGNNLGTNAQLIVLTTSGLLAYAGVDNGQLGIASVAEPGAFTYLPTPRQFLAGTETIADLFVHGTSTTQRWFILTNLGNLYACGSNVDSICTGGVSSNTMNANAEWQRIAFK